MTFIPAYPRIDATIRENKTGELTINGTSRPLAAADLARLRAGVIARCAATARQVHRPVRVHVVDVAGIYAIAIHPDAFVQVLDEEGNTADLDAAAPRPISNSPCRRCGTSVPLSAASCPACNVEDPHDVQAAPASALVTAPIEIPAPPARAEPTELLARWSLTPADDALPVAGGLSDDAEHTVVMQTRQRRPSPILRFSTGQALTVKTSAFVGRNPGLGDGENTAELFTVEDHSRTVSKTHFRIDWHDGHLMIMDRHSANGIVVQRGLDSPKTIAPMANFELHDKDSVQLGDQSFTVSIAPLTAKES
ncbi:MAG: FHA domain-containing protein [Leifsonia sp.]